MDAQFDDPEPKFVNPETMRAPEHTIDPTVDAPFIFKVPPLAICNDCRVPFPDPSMVAVVVVPKTLAPETEREPVTAAEAEAANTPAEVRV